jgi:hypothetical protein
LQQEYKNLGLNDEAFEGVAAFGETLGINEETLANFVKGAKDLLKREQSNADKVRNANAESKKQVEDLKAKLADAEAKLKNNEGDGDKNPDIAKIVADAVSAAVQPLQQKITEFEGAKSAEEALNSAKSLFFANDYAKKYTDERDYAWERVVEINELTGKKMTSDELQAKAMGYFNNAVAKKGVDTSKPFKSEGDGDAVDFSAIKKNLEESGRIQKQ